MTSTIATEKPALHERVTRIILWPGEAACNALSIQDEDSRTIFRMFVNSSVYAKIGIGLVFALT